MYMDYTEASFILFLFYFINKERALLKIYTDYLLDYISYSLIGKETLSGQVKPSIKYFQEILAKGCMF